MSRNLNIIDADPTPPVAGAPAGPPSPATAPPTDDMSPSLPRPASESTAAGSRAGPVLIVLGLCLISLQFLFSAYVYNEITNSPTNFNFKTTELLYALGWFAEGLGIVLASVGWTVDKRATARSLGAAGPGESKGRTLAGQVVAILGAIIAAIGAFTIGVIEFSVYASVTLMPPLWLVTFVYATLGVGVLAIAAGWALYRSAQKLG